MLHCCLCIGGAVKDVLGLLELRKRMSQHLGTAGCETVARLSQAYAGGLGLSRTAQFAL